MKIELLETGGWYTVFKNLRQSYKLDSRSIYKYDFTKIVKNANGELGLDINTSIGIHPNDLTLLSILVKKGDSHSKIIRGLQTYVEITAPRYFWQEWITYVIGVLEINPTIDWVSLNSESTIHIIKKGVTNKNFCNYTMNEVIKLINEVITFTDVEEPDNNSYNNIKANLPEGYLQTRTFQVSYQAWRRIYQQRHNHKLEEWNKDVVEFIESLPFAKELITIN